MTHDTPATIDYFANPPIGEELDFSLFLQNPFDPFSANVLSSSPDSSPSSYSSDNADLYYLNEDTLFGTLNDVCPLPVSSDALVKPEPPKAAEPKTPCKVPPPSKSSLVGKKRSRKALQTNTSKSAIAPDFQNMSSKTLEEYQHQLESSRELTIEEERQLKKQRRLIKNRESAQLSRQRKKQYIVDLESNVRLMASETEQLRQQVAQLTSRNIELENQVAQLKSMMNSIPVKHPKAAIGLCMIVFLLSLGVFFPPPSMNSASHPPGEFPHPTSVYTGRVLKELAAPNEVGMLEEMEMRVPEKRPIREYLSDEPASKRKAHVFDEEEIASDSVSLQSYSEQSSPYSLTVVNDHHKLLLEPASVDSVEQEVKTSSDPDSHSYIYCSEAHPLSIPANPPRNDAAPVITVLLPSSALNGTIPHMEEFLDEPENTLLEVSCQILNITVYPFYPDVDGRLTFPMLGSI